MIHVFAGPTLAHDEARELLPGCRVHPPIRFGDLLRIDVTAGDVVAIIDGYFHQAPAVRHQELLAAIDAGVVVYGSSSMGALRAAELSSAGMRGCGEVFDLYAGGVIDGDDEVTVAHLGVEDGFRSVTTALVDIRRHCEDACALGVIDRPQAGWIVAAARTLSYDLRGYGAILRAQNFDTQPFRAFVDEHGVSAKHEDAVRLLTLLRDPGAGAAPTPPGSFVPNVWHYGATERLDGRRDADGIFVNDRTVLDLVSLTATAYPAWRERVVLTEFVRSSDVPRPDGTVELRRFRSDQGLEDPDAYSAWLRQRFLSEGELARCLERIPFASLPLDELRECARRHAAEVGLWRGGIPSGPVAQMWLDAEEYEVLTPLETAARVLVRSFQYGPAAVPVSLFTTAMKISGCYAAARRMAMSRRPMHDHEAARSDVLGWCAENWGTDSVTTGAILDRGIGTNAHLCGFSAADILVERAAPFFARAAMSGPYPGASLDHCLLGGPLPTVESSGTD
jgi:hypothetical protein